jgi:hypothetical protein
MWVFSDNLGREDKEKYGRENCWHEWSLKNWGTKWNAYGQKDKRNKGNVIYFQTAWSGVPELIEKITFIFPDVKLKYYYCDEDYGYNVGMYEFKDAKTINKIIPKGGSEEAERMADKIDDNDF